MVGGHNRSVTEAAQRVLDRIPHLDPRSLGFPIRTVGTAFQKPPRSYSYACAVHLDQGREGECVPHGYAHEAMARPVVRNVEHALVHEWYRMMQAVDPWRDQPHDGTSVLAGAKVYVQQGRATGYRWAFGIGDLIPTLAYNGPVIAGTDWMTGMFQPTADNFLHVTGRIEAGHCYLIKGQRLVWLAGTTPQDKAEPDWLTHLDLQRSYVIIHNSWGEDWGRGGDAYLSMADLRILLANQGELCVPVGRR